MPMDDVAQSPKHEEYGLTRVKVWDLKFCWTPKTCFFSGRQLWGKYAYQGIRYIHGPGEPVIDVYWIDKHEFIIWKLKGSK